MHEACSGSVEYASLGDMMQKSSSSLDYCMRQAVARSLHAINNVDGGIGMPETPLSFVELTPYPTTQSDSLVAADQFVHLWLNTGDTTTRMLPCQATNEYLAAKGSCSTYNTISEKSMLIA